MFISSIKILINTYTFSKKNKKMAKKYVLQHNLKKNSVYSFELELELPESTTNTNIGMFMIEVSVKENHNEKGKLPWLPLKQKIVGSKTIIQKFSKPVSLFYNNIVFL